MANDVLGIMTDGARKRQNIMYSTGKSFKVDKFAVTSNGHDPSNVSMPLAPDPELECSDADDCGAAALWDIDSVTQDPNGCPVFNISLDPGEETGVISQILLYAIIVYPSNDPEYNTRFLFGVVNFGLKSKGALDPFTAQVGIF